MKPISAELVAQVVRPRNPQTHKGDYGRVLVIGGAAQYGGAGILSASAAVAGGAGLVTLATASVNRGAAHARIPEAMVVSFTNAAALKQAIAQATVIVIGPGLGLDDTAHTVLARTLAQVTPAQTLIVDGSAITLLAQAPVPLPTTRVIWTPHQMEWQRLSGIPIAAQSPTANQAAATGRGTVIVKQHRTQIFTPTAAWENPIGGPELATGGSGDTLTGILAAFVAQFGYRDAPVCAAVYTHSAIAAQLAKTAYVALPSAVIAELPHYMKQQSIKAGAYAIIPSWLSDEIS